MLNCFFSVSTLYITCTHQYSHHIKQANSHYLHYGMGRFHAEYWLVQETSRD